MPSPQESELLNLLSRAEAEFRHLEGKPIWSSYSSGPEIADLISSARGQIQAGSLAHETSRELWSIFAPTCDWDDVIGDVDLGNAIFEILNSRYRPIS